MTNEFRGVHVLKLAVGSGSAILAGLCIFVTAVKGDMLGSRIELQIAFPDVSTQESTSPIATVSNSTVEFPTVLQYQTTSALVNDNIDILGSAIEINFSDLTSGSFAVDPFNGYVFTDIDGTIPSFTGFTIDNSVTTLGIQPSSLSFNDNQLFINVSGLSFTSSTFAKFDVQFVPEPSSIMLAAMGLAGLSISIRRRNR